jgi:adenylate cyclase
MDLNDIFGRPPRILVADDDWLNRDLLQAYLIASGCEVVTAADGQTALELARENPPDLALLDVMMPRMDGLELCAALKSEPEMRFIPVVIVTAIDSEGEKVKALDVGADEFISKPYNSLILLTRVRSLLRIKKLNDDIEARNRLLRHVLDRFLAEDVTDVILTDPERYLKLGGESRIVTVLFADIRGFSRFTEQVSASQVIETLNSIFEALSEVIFTHKGTFDKYLGDGLMAFFGAPVEAEDDAQRAFNSALDMMRIFSKLDLDPEASKADLGLGIGIHTGEAVVGNIGSEKVMDYTVVGYAVNVAKRLQEISRGGQILLSEATYKHLKDVKAEKLEDVQLPQLQERITAYLVEEKGE